MQTIPPFDHPIATYAAVGLHDPYDAPTIPMQPLAQPLGRDVTILVRGHAQKEFFEQVRIEANGRRTRGLDEAGAHIRLIELELGQPQDEPLAQLSELGIV